MIMISPAEPPASETTRAPTRSFIDAFADFWSSSGASRIEGLIAGYLLIDESDGVSPQQLAETLGISRGSVSNYTRALVERGFVRRIRKPGDRAHYFMMDDDVWAGFLATEQAYLRNQHQLAETTLPQVTPGSRAWNRVRNMRDYMDWLLNIELGHQWEQVKAARDRDLDPTANLERE